MALGAAAGNVQTMIVMQNPWMVALVILASLGPSRLITNMLFGVVPHDPSTYVAPAGLVLSVASLGCRLPAIRATRVDPLAAVLHE